MLRPLRLLLVTAFLLGCGDDDVTPPADADTDAPDAPMACTPLGAFEAGDADGALDPLSLPPGEARAGRLEASELPVDRMGLARWRPGDFVLANEHVALLVSARDVPGEAYDPHGGRLVGAALVEDGALVAPADFGIVILALQRFLVATESVTVMNDGTDGGAAAIRVVGPLARLEAFGTVLDALLPQNLEGAPAALDYTLEPGARHASVRLSVRAGTTPLRAPIGALQAFFQSYRMPAWSPGTGFVAASSATPHVIFDGSGQRDRVATSYAWAGEDEPLTPFFQTGGADLFASGGFLLAPCAEGSISLGRVVIGANLPDVQAALADLAGESTTRLAGRVTVAGEPLREGRVHVTAGEGSHVTRFDVDEDGRFDVPVDARATELWVWRPSLPLAGPFPITEPAIDLPATARLPVEVRDADAGTLLPARVELFARAGTPLPVAPPELGERSFGQGRAALVYAASGEATLEVAPGAYTLRISRGPTYEIVETDLELEAGEASPFLAELVRAIVQPGVLCGDLHVHTHRSVDSADPGALKVLGLVADGVDVVVRTEHEFVSDFQPLIDDLGLADFARGYGGLELTTFGYGHFNVFPLEPDANLPSDGAISWYGLRAPELFARVRARPEAPTLIINHPRTAGRTQAYFADIGFDPITGSVRDADQWDEEFTVVEVFNNSNLERERDANVRDWFGLLNAGRRVVAVGSSDSHGIYGSPVGYPRTCAEVGTDTIRGLDPRVFQAAIDEGRSVISGGVFLDVRGPDDVGPGREATGVGAVATFEVVVRAAAHVAVDRLEVIVDGNTVEMLPITPEDADEEDPVVRARATIEVDVAPAGSWVIFHAAGDTAYEARGGSMPFAVSNPVWLRR